MAETQTATKEAVLVEMKALPEPKANIVPYGQTPQPEQSELDGLIAKINMGDSESIIVYGSEAQKELTDVADEMLSGVRNKDAGPAGTALNKMVTELRGFNPDVKGGGIWGWLKRLFNISAVAQFIQRYETVQNQVNAIQENLEGHQQNMLEDIVKLDKLYEKTLAYFKSLEHYIAAGEEKLRRVREEDIPKLEKKALESNDVIDAQALKDLTNAAMDLERKIHDLKLTRQVTMQSLPSIRLMQDNDKNLVNKIQSTIVNTLPLWKTQLAQALAIFRSQQAAGAVKNATDLTNELLEANAENLRKTNKEIREEIERGIVDIESVKKANNDLIATIEESLTIAQEGQRKRREAEKELERAEEELKDALRRAAKKPEPEAAAV